MKIFTRLIAITWAMCALAAADQKWEKTTILQFHPKLMGVSGDKEKGDPLAKEVATITSPEILRKVATSLGVPKEELNATVADFQKKITTHRRPETHLVEIKVIDTNPKLAALLANKVAEIYLNHLHEKTQQQSKAALKALDQELAQQNELVQKQRKALTELIQKYGIPYIDGKEPKAPASGKAQPFKKSLQALKEAPKRKRLRLAASINIPNNPVRKPYQQYLHALEDQDQLSKAFLSKHPKMVEVKKRINRLHKEAHKATEQLIKQLEKPTNAPLPTSPSRQQYLKAKENYEQTRKMLQDMKAKQEKSRVSLKIPQQPASLHERAQ